MQEKFIFINKYLAFLILEGYQRKMLSFLSSFIKLSNYFSYFG